MPVIGYPQQKAQGSIWSPSIIQGYVSKTHTVVFELLPRSAYSSL